MKIMNFFKSDKEIDAEIKYAGIAKYMPLIICGGFYLLTILLFAFGPFDWKVQNAKDLYTFVIYAFIALVLGYILGCKINRKKKLIKLNINHIIPISFCIFIIMYILNCYVTTGKLYPDVIRGLFDSGNAYRISHSEFSSLSTYLFYFSILTAPFTAFIIPLFYIYYKGLNKYNKVIGYIVIILNLFLGIAQGVINSYAVLAFQVCMFLLIYLFSNFNTKSSKKQLTIIILILGILGSFFLYYKIVMSNRLIADAMPTETIQENTQDNSQTKDNKKNNKKNVKENEFSKEQIDSMLESSAEFITQTTIKEKYFYSFLPQSILNSINHVVGYLTHGYKGLSFALQKKFTSSYGLGFSDFFRHNFLKLIGKTNIEQKIYERTYMYKILGDGWETGAVWSTFFIYPASDIGFPLTILLVFFIGFIFSLSWRDALESKNIFAAIIFINLCMIICFFCANNVYLQNGASFLTIILMLILWFIFRIFGKEN